MFEPYLSDWSLTPDGESIVTATSRLLPVVWEGQKAMLKLAMIEEERAGGAMMAWFGGHGAARVLAHAGDALLMERATSARSLCELIAAGQDGEACEVLCAVAAQLHAPRVAPTPKLIGLEHWFRALSPKAAAYGGVLSRCDKASRMLLSTPEEVTPLHGDLHHDNVLDFGVGGWRAVDPKCLLGERGFDFANIFCNPDLDTAAEPGRFLNRLERVTQAARLDRRRLLHWILAWCGLSAAFSLQDGEGASLDALWVAELAAAELDR